MVGSDFQQIDFKVTQGAGETRIAAAAGVPPIVVGLSEGLVGHLLQLRTGSTPIRGPDDAPLWRNMASSMSNIIDVPPRAELWYDDRDIPALQEDAKDAAEVLQTHAATISSLVNAGYEADSVKAAVISGDFSQLQHTGLFSVQLQPPMPDGPELNAQNGAPVQAAAG